MTTEIEDRTYERSLDEAKLDALYYARLHERHARLYRRIRLLITVVTLFAGTTAFASALGKNGVVVGISGVIVTLMSIIDVTFDFASRVAMHESQRRRYLKLLAEWPGDLDEADKKLALLSMKSPGEIEGLRVPAYNDNVRSNGRNSYALPLTAWQWLLDVIA